MANRNSSAFQLSQPQPAAGGSSAGNQRVYRGIRLRAGKWVSEIREPNKSTRIWLGTYPIPEMAAAAYDVAALALKGTSATLNFPESVLSYTLPECPTADNIRNAAARAAAARSPECSRGGSMMRDGNADVFVDDETMFGIGMPNLLLEMAEGMLLSPPRIDSDVPDDGDFGGGNLWNY